MKAEYFLLHVK